MSAPTPNGRALDYVEHMQEAISLALSHVEGLTKEDFLADKKTQQAVIFNILVIGEAATKIATAHPELLAQYPQVPWQQMRGMRNRLAHGYFEINLDLVWETLCSALPPLQKQLDEISKKGPEGL